MSGFNRIQESPLPWLIALLALGAVVAYIDHHMGLHTMLVETVHALIVTAIFFFCLLCQKKYPQISRVGWQAIVWGTAFLMIGSWIDLLDDPPVINLFQIHDVPFGRSWQQAFLKKILGYSAGIGLIAVGFFRWIPWMIDNQLQVRQLNESLARVNQKLNRTVMSLDEHLESERARISRELHDDVAQQLTYLNIQLQLLDQPLATLPAETTAPIRAQLGMVTSSVSDTLKSVRQLCGNLRPESLYALGLIPALEQYLEKMSQQYLQITFRLEIAENLQDKPLGNLLGDHRLWHVYRIIQESVRNAAKHSEGSEVVVRLSESDDTTILKLEICDNGKGLPWQYEMPSDDWLVQRGHLGIVGLRERVHEVGGTFDMHNLSTSGAGLMVLVPYRIIDGNTSGDGSV